MNLGQQITYIQLLQQHTHIQIPIIQRDYAQGRPDEQEVRDTFLAALEDALLKPAHDVSLPLNLDFIYGSVEEFQGKTQFLPLDGQQRLTTLFLLHWYLRESLVSATEFGLVVMTFLTSWWCIVQPKVWTRWFRLRTLYAINLGFSEAGYATPLSSLFKA